MSMNGNSRSSPYNPGNQLNRGYGFLNSIWTSPNLISPEGR